MDLRGAGQLSKEQQEELIDSHARTRLLHVLDILVKMELLNKVITAQVGHTLPTHLTRKAHWVVTKTAVLEEPTRGEPALCALASCCSLAVQLSVFLMGLCPSVSAAPRGSLLAADRRVLRRACRRRGAHAPLQPGQAAGVGRVLGPAAGDGAVPPQQ